MRTRSGWRYGATALVCAACLAAIAACASGGQGPWAPAPIIVPDAITIPTGASQVFRVENAAVAGFSLTCEGCDWRTVVSIDPQLTEANAVRLIGLRPSGGNLYLTADLGSHRDPLVAVIAIR